MTGFDAFWSAWPRNTERYTRKGAKAECLKRWIARHHETQADQIVKHVEWLKTTADWLKDGGAFIPAPLVYLNQQRWDGAEIPCNQPSCGVSSTQAMFAEWEREKAALKPIPPEIQAKLALVRRKA